MAENILEIPGVLPMKFKDTNFTNPAPYNTKYFENFHYRETIPYYLSADDYYQPWQKNDIIYLQLMANYGPHSVEIINNKGYLVTSIAFAPVATSLDSGGLLTYRASIALNTLPEGVYKLQLKSGDPLTITTESDWFCLKELHQGSILFTYKHSENDFGVAFETGVEFSFRVHGGFKEFQPQSERVVFIDQPSNIVQLSSKSFHTEKLIIGNAYGVPKWVIDKINQVFDCDTVLVDGKQWVAVSGARFEANRLDRYTKEGWSIEVRPAKRRSGNRFVNDAPAAATEYYVTYNIEGGVLGDRNAPASSNVIQIIKNE